jgi:peptide/nickel transport system substrate-binding protein
VLPVVEKRTQSFLTSDVRDTPEEGAAVSKVQYPQSWLPRTGEMNYNGEQKP